MDLFESWTNKKNNSVKLDGKFRVENKNRVEVYSIFLCLFESFYRAHHRNSASFFISISIEFFKMNSKYFYPTQMIAQTYFFSDSSHVITKFQI